MPSNKPTLTVIEQKILEILKTEQVTGLQLAEMIGINRNTVSKYLLRLEALGLIEHEDLGNKNIYSQKEARK